MHKGTKHDIQRSMYVNNHIILLVQSKYYYGIRILPRRYDKYIFFLNKRFSILIFTTENKIMFMNNINHKNAAQIF